MAGDTASITDEFSVLYHYLQEGYENTKERIEFFAESLESGKSNAILLHKYLREDDHPYGTYLYGKTKTNSFQFSTQAYDKEYNKNKRRVAGR